MAVLVKGAVLFADEIYDANALREAVAERRAWANVGHGRTSAWANIGMGEHPAQSQSQGLDPLQQIPVSRAQLHRALLQAFSSHRDALY
jgi:hypothetical protein